MDLDQSWWKVGMTVVWIFQSLELVSWLSFLIVWIGNQMIVTINTDGPQYVKHPDTDTPVHIVGFQC